jgi:type I restriction enzyme S subunit
VVAPKFVFYFSKGFNFHKLDKSTTIPSLAKRDLLSIKFPLAPLPEQRAIVAKIEQLFSELDNGISNLKSAKDKLEIYRQAVLKKAFEGELTKEWRERTFTIEPWKSKSIGDVVSDLTQGWSPRCLNSASVDYEEWAVIKTSAVQPTNFIPMENKILPFDQKPKIQHEIKNGDILITRAGPRNRVGICCLVRKVRPKLLNCDKVYRLKLTEDVSGLFFEYLMNSTGFVNKLDELKTGGNDSGLNLTQNRFLNLKIPIPPLSEQHQIVQEIETRLSVCDNILANINESLDKSEALRQSILKQAFEGKLLSETELEACRREPDWQHAEKLLERIKKSKHAMA